MPNNKKKTMFLAVGELLFIVVCACLLSASVIDTTNGIIRSEQKQAAFAVVNVSPELRILDEDIDADFEQTGKGSWYGGGFHSRKTASGERFNMNGFTAAHRSWPFGTIVRVTDMTTNKSILVCINDRGPFIRSKVIDLSQKAAQTIGGTLKNLRLEAFFPGKSLVGYSSTDKNCHAPIVGFDEDLQLMSVASRNIEPWTYTDNFNNALFIQKELNARFPDNDVLISYVQEPISGGNYAVFVIPTDSQVHPSREMYGSL